LVISSNARFAETESIVALAMLLARYEVKVDEEKFPSIPGESRLVRPFLVSQDNNLG
jgi:hypothetical protein